MDKIKNKRTIIIAIGIMLVAIAILTVILIGKVRETAGTVITEKNLPEVAGALREAGLSNTDLFETWVYEYYENKDSNTEAYSDADCRMTAMLLFDDQISCENAEEYKGDYLMIDVDKIENEDTNIFIRDNLQVFTTLFGETKIPDGGIEKALPENWKKHGIKVFNENASLVSLMFTTTDGKEVFTGHTGVLIDCSKLEDSEFENYLFVEKLAFNEAFMATELKDPSELIDLLSQRDDYTTEEGEHKPLMYINDELIGELK